MSIALTQLKAQAGAPVTQAIKRASADTGVDFSYLMRQASAESAFRTEVKAATSSATGLFQFIDSTWMAMLDKYGSKHGVDMDQSRASLLNLRKDPELSSLMAGELANENKNYLKNVLGADSDIGATELYFAHFLGSPKAAAFLKAHEETPYKVAADAFPREAQANRNVFYNAQTGNPRTYAEIYAHFDKKFMGSDTLAPAQRDTMMVAEKSAPSVQKPSIEIAQGRYKGFDFLMTEPIKTPIMRESNSKFPSFAFGSLVTNSADILWLAALDDVL